jgi:hypothetical protein
MNSRDKSLRKRSTIIHILSFLIISFSKIVGDDKYEIWNIDISFIMIMVKIYHWNVDIVTSKPERNYGYISQKKDLSKPVKSGRDRPVQIFQPVRLPPWFIMAMRDFVITLHKENTGFISEENVEYRENRRLL